MSVREEKREKMMGFWWGWLLTAWFECCIAAGVSPVKNIERKLGGAIKYGGRGRILWEVINYGEITGLVVIINLVKNLVKQGTQVVTN